MYWTLKQAIKHSCFSQKQVALIIDIDKFHFNKLVNNRDKISNKIIQKLIQIKELKLRANDLDEENILRKSTSSNRQKSCSAYWDI